MINLLSNYYLYIKALHIISMVCWMSGMFYLPRLFVYHSSVDPYSETSQTFKVMEKRLLKIIINPAMVLTFVFGGLLMMIPGVIASFPGSFHVKLILVLIMAAIHGMMVGFVKDFAHDQNTKSSKYFRIFNEVPTLLLIAIIFLVVVKPF